METPTRHLRVLDIVTVVAVCVVGYVVYNAFRPVPPEPRPTAQSSDAQPSPLKKVAEEPPNVESKPAPQIPVMPRPQKPQSRIEAPKGDRVVKADTLRKIHESLGKAEFRGAKVLYERTFPDGRHERAVELPALPKEVVEDAYAELGRGLKALTTDSALAEKLKAEALREVALFTDRPKAFKVLKIRTPKEVAEKIYAVEYFVDDLKTALPNAAGVVTIRLGSGPGQTIVRDGYYNEDEGWVRERYAHFFEEAPW